MLSALGLRVPYELELEFNLCTCEGLYQYPIEGFYSGLGVVDALKGFSTEVLTDFKPKTPTTPL